MPVTLLAPQDPISENTVGVIAILSVFVLFPIAIAFARMIWKRASDPPPVDAPETTRRLSEMQQSLDAMAVEIERIAEGQRFVTRLMSERPAGELASPPRARKES